MQKSEFGDNIYIKTLCLYRGQSQWFEKLNYSCKKDTIFLLELPGIQGNYNLTFWNNIDTISFTNETGEFKSANKPLFTKYMMKLVSEWNIQEIEKEENENTDLIPNEIVYATRIIFSNKKSKIDCFYFKDFFNYERDGTNFSD